MQTYDVVIVGAGIAGLVAAHQLREMGITNIIVLEAQDYVGGRIKTSLDWGHPIELGAEFIHGEQTITARLARELNLDYVNAYEDVKLVDADGKVLDRTAKDAYYDLRKYTVEHGIDDVPIYDIIENNAEDYDLTIKQFVHMAFTDLEGADSDKLDSGALRDAFNFGTKNGRNIMLRDGYQAVVSHFSEGLPISLESPVSSIDYRDPDLIKATLSGGEQIFTKRVIVTVPLGVLKSGSITFMPELPSDKQKSIQKLGMGNNMKLILRFRGPHEVTDFFRYADGMNGSLQTISNWWATATDPRVLVGYCGGTRAAAVLSLPEDRLIEKVLIDLSKILGRNLEDELTDYKISRWDTNPFVLGSYSYHPVHAKLKDRDYLAAPIEGRVFWAGEATTANENYATVHGAIESGYRVADEVEASLVSGTTTV